MPYGFGFSWTMAALRRHGATSTPATIYGPAYPGAVITSSGDFGWRIAALTGIYRGALLNRVPDNHWYINDVDTGESGPTFTVPLDAVGGDVIRRGIHSNELTVIAIDAPTIHGPAFAGSTLTRSGEFAWIISGTPVPGAVISRIRNNEWTINGVPTGSTDDEFVCPGTLAAGDLVRCGNSVNTLIAEGEGGIYAAWGLRALVPDHTGPLVRLRRSTDSSERDFGGTGADGWVDNAAVAAWQGAGTNTVVKLHDLTGRGRDWTQSDNNARPVFVPDGARSHVAFSAGRHLVPSDAGMLDMMRYVPGLTVGVVMRQPANPAAGYAPVSVTTGDSTTAPRIGLSITTARDARWTMVADWDEAAASSTALVRLDDDWHTHLVQADAIQAGIRATIDGSASASGFSQAARTRNRPSLAARLNGTTSDTGGVWDFRAMVIHQRALPDADAAALTAGLDSLDTLSLPARGIIQTYADIPSTVHPYGDSMTHNLGVAAVEKWTSLCGFYWDKYRMFVNRGLAGQTADQISARLLADITAGKILSGDLVIYYAGRNDPDFDNIMQRTADVVAAIPAGVNLVIIGFCNAVSESSGNPNYATCLAVNAALASTYPDNYLDLRTAWVNSYNPAIPQDVIDHGRDTPPASQTLDGLHFNPLGNSIAAGIIAPGIIGLGY
ncbi:MAG: hypothetical protein V4726_11200 [Verrucomicrobiota bacterium]